MMKYKNKYKNKNHLIFNKNKNKNSTLHFGKIGLISISPGFLKEKELLACNTYLLKHKKFIGKNMSFMKVNPFLSLTSNPIATRMGKGKGGITDWILPVKIGMVLFEINCNLQKRIQIISILKKASNTLSLKTKIIENIY